MKKKQPKTVHVGVPKKIARRISVLAEELAKKEK